MDAASPQLEHGYTRVANELLEAIVKYPFNATELKIVLIIIRKTYGWKKKKAVISHGAIAAEAKTGIRYVKRTMKSLIQDKVILKEKQGFLNVFGLNKDYKSWRLWKSPVDSGQ